MEPLIEQPTKSTTESKRETRKHRRACSRECSRADWWLEIGSSLFSVLCLLGIVILLSRIQDQPLSSWYLAVSPNAFISVLSTASKACLIQPEFDNASRGPLGSFQFFCKRPTKSLLPYLGCIIFLAAIAADSFAQQILSFETKLIAASGVFSELSTSQFAYEWDYGAIAQIQKTVKLSLYDEPHLPDLTCPGSVCRYPSFSSIGVTSECKDVTALSEGNCTIPAVDPQYPGHEHCNFTTPGGFQLQAIQLHVGDDTSSLDMTGSSSATESPRLNEVLLEFGILQVPVTSLTLRDRTRIHECTIKLCAIEYADWYVTHETIHPGLMQAYPMNNITRLEDMLQGEDMMRFTVPDPAFSYNRTYGMTIDNVATLNMILEKSLISTLQGQVLDSPATPLFQSPDVPATVANLSAALSYRMLGGPNATVTAVPVLDDVLVITVRWAWISLPAGLVVAACLFLLAVIYRTRRAEHLVWKSSLTPLLLSQEPYPVLRAGQRPLWTRSYLKARTAVIVNHLTK
ncbi:uncharacterized protein PG986_006483 [Apiospora aurea]|uniref:Uncharacterized protein n=1 Tax=Apiospora aurea TaxID=335848 RepID=A0ABR1QKJ9_9PEZI